MHTQTCSRRLSLVKGGEKRKEERLRELTAEVIFLLGNTEHSQEDLIEDTLPLGKSADRVNPGRSTRT